MKGGEKMDALTFINQNYNGTNIEATKTSGIKSIYVNNLDCNCVDSDCSTETYEY